MKKFICLLAFTGLLAECFGQVPHYEITGLIDGAEGVSFSLQKNVNGKPINVNGATVTNGILKIIGGTDLIFNTGIAQQLNCMASIPFLQIFFWIKTAL